VSKGRNGSKEEEDRDYDPEDADEFTDDETGEEEEEDEGEEEEEGEDDSGSGTDYPLENAANLLKNFKKPSPKKISKTASSNLKTVQRPGPGPAPKKEIKKSNEKRKRKADPNTDAGPSAKKSSLSISVYDDTNMDKCYYPKPDLNIEVKKMGLSPTLMVMCHVLDTSETKMPITSDFAALTFLKKMKEEKVFNFSIPFALVPALQDALGTMVGANKQFFIDQKKKTTLNEPTA
jgi:hypothetical protein